MEQIPKERAGIVRPYSNLRNIYKARTILVVATEGCLSVPDDLETFTEGKNPVNVHFAKGLPLPKGDKHPPIDAVAFIYEVSNEESFKTIKQSLPFVDLRFFVSKCFILVFSENDFFSSNTKDIEELAAAFHIPIHFVSRHKDPANPESKPRLKLPSELISVYCPPIGNDVNSLMVDAAIQHGVME